MSAARPGHLLLVATPIGNLEDITLRAIRVLREADKVLAEDTRRTLTLLRHLEIDTPLASLHAHTSAERVEALADELSAGARFALVSDAGTPIVSDPGRELVRAALRRGCSVEAIPGPSAVTAAVCVSGLDAGRFRFVGFLPRSGKARRAALAAIADDELASILFESPERIAKTLAELSEVAGPERQAALCRELTKLHEEVLRGALSDLAEQTEGRLRGEITLVVAGRGPKALAAPLEAGDLESEIEARLARGDSARDVARALADEHGIERRAIYQQVLAQKARERQR